MFDDAVKTGCCSTFSVVPDQTATVPLGECLTPFSDRRNWTLCYSKTYTSHVLFGTATGVGNIQHPSIYAADAKTLNATHPAS